MKTIKLSSSIIASQRKESTVDERTQSEKLLAYYEEAGPDYAAWSKNFNMHFGYYKIGLNPFDREAMLEHMNEVVLDKLEFGKLERGAVADFGCGLGATLRYARKRNDKVDLSGVTLVPWQVQQAREINSSNKSTENIKITEADYCHTPLEDNSLDGVWAIESSCYAKGNNKSDLIAEIQRVLKPGGKFVIADGFRKHGNTMNGLITSAYNQLCHSWALSELGDINAVRESLEDAGFRAINVENASFLVAPSVAHVPFTVLSFLIKEFLFGRRKMSKERWDNLKSPLLTMVIGLAQSHFGYYIISGTK